MSDADDLQAKWDARYAEGRVEDSAPCGVLVEYAHLLPRAGRALDLACGLGGNALWLARRGLDTTAWDLSPVAIGKLAGCAQLQALPLTAEVRDALKQPPPARSFDVIVVSRFLDRALMPALIAALRDGGLLCYQTFTRETPNANGPACAAFRLAPNELLRFADGLRILVYREEGLVGDTTQGLRGEAWLVAQRATLT